MRIATFVEVAHTLHATRYTLRTMGQPNYKSYDRVARIGNEIMSAVVVVKNRRITILLLIALLALQGAYTLLHLLTPSMRPTVSNEDQNGFLVVGSMEQIVSQCLPITTRENEELRAEILHYEKSQRFHDKIAEVRGSAGVAAHHKSIDAFLKSKVLRPGWSVLELGCAAGAMLQMVKRAYEDGIGEHKEFVGVELVTGWVKFAQEYFADKGIHVFEGDVTNFTLPAPFASKTFDFVMVNDVAEHIQKSRYGCFFSKLKASTHEGSIVYFHTPNPTAQIADHNQFYENTLPHHYVVAGMAYANFELVTFEQDVTTRCGGKVSSVISSIANSQCNVLGYPKYYHAVFRRVERHKVFALQ